MAHTAFRTFAIILGATATLCAFGSSAANAPDCTQFSAPTIANCKAVPVAEISKASIELYRLEGTQTIFDHSLAKEKICLPFQATDCSDPNFLMIETSGHTRFLFHKSDVTPTAPTCYCPPKETTVDAGSPGGAGTIGAPGAGKLKKCGNCP
ncbi:MAG: hypothetical protein WAW96_08970 [Alphaproteobacteria bacterium]